MCLSLYLTLFHVYSDANLYYFCSSKLKVKHYSSTDSCSFLIELWQFGKVLVHQTFAFCSEEGQFLLLRLDLTLHVLQDFPVAIISLCILIFPCGKRQTKS